ncbi:unnamed protein product [Lactuca virosa]|uniref:PB1-like domain-containing protein n=1 Tax=Lactuca virosa TaxID=75947 RepID=A0AAU9PWC5_9ASTR|nr:unnamed protein product [Lactuca virosa]
MTSSKARKSSIEINFNGMFVTSPFAYEGGEIKALDNLDFTTMEYSEFSDFLKKETDADCSGIYYVIPGKELHNGLRLIKSDVDFKIFVDYGHRSKRRIALYLEHFDEDLTEYLEGVEDVVNHKMDESENETDSMSDDDDDDDDVDDDDDDDDDESEDTASIDHLSADEVELSELRKKKRARIIEPIMFGSGRNSLFDADVDELSKEDTMVIEHESFLNELSMSLQKQTHNNMKNDGVKYPRHNPSVTLISNEHMGVIEAVNDVLPQAEHRQSENWDDDICPTIRKKLEHTKELERFWRVIPCGGSLFEGVTPLAQKPAVNMPRKRGKLRKRKRDAMEVYVSSGSGAMVAHVSGGGVVVHSSGGGTVDREGRRMTCKKCLQVGHNVRSCKNEKRDSPRKEARQAGRKKVIIVSEGGGGRTGGRGGRRGRGGGRKGLFGSDHMTEDDVIGCGDDIPLAVWPPLGVPLLLDKQHVEVAKQEETGMELTSQNQEESGMELTSQNKEDGVEVKDKEASPNKDEGLISHGVEDPIPIKVEGSPPPIPHEEDKGPIPIQVEDPIPHKHQDTPSNKDQEPTPIKEQDPSIISEDQGPIPIEVEGPEDQEPIPTKDQEAPIIHEDEGPIPIEVEVEVADPISHEDHEESIPTKDQKPISNGEHEHQEFIPNEAKESIPSRMKIKNLS